MNVTLVIGDKITGKLYFSTALFTAAPSSSGLNFAINWFAPRSEERRVGKEC